MLDTETFARLPNAACAGLPVDLFIPDTDAGQVTPAWAKALCDDCPERSPCLERAIATRAPGWWGGTSMKDRRAIIGERLAVDPTSVIDGPRSQALAARKARVVALYRSGVNPNDIANEESITSRSVHRIVAAHRERHPDVWADWQPQAGGVPIEWTTFDIDDVDDEPVTQADRAAATLPAVPVGLMHVRQRRPRRLGAA